MVFHRNDADMSNGNSILTPLSMFSSNFHMPAMDMTHPLRRVLDGAGSRLFPLTSGFPQAAVHPWREMEEFQAQGPCTVEETETTDSTAGPGKRENNDRIRHSTR